MNLRWFRREASGFTDCTETVLQFEGPRGWEDVPVVHESEERQRAVEAMEEASLEREARFAREQLAAMSYQQRRALKDFGRT